MARRESLINEDIHSTNCIPLYARAKSLTSSNNHLKPIYMLRRDYRSFYHLKRTHYSRLPPKSFSEPEGVKSLRTMSNNRTLPCKNMQHINVI